MPRIGTLPLAVLAACGSSFCVQPGTLRLADLHIGTTGSRVPTCSLNRARAIYMPDAAWAINRFLPRLIPGCQTGPGSGVISDSRHLTDGLSTSPSRFLPDASHDAFSAHVHHDRLFTDAARGGLEPSPAEGLRGAHPPSAGQHQIQRLLSTSEAPPSFAAHVGCHLGCHAPCG